MEADDAGVRRLCLNGRPYFHNGLLDQGYWPDGLYTAPSDEAMIYDIELARRMGFNMLRKHIKVEPARWYYHCDRLGMLVWQDMPCGGGVYSPPVVSAPLVTGRHLRDNAYFLFGRGEKAGREEFERELRDMTSSDGKYELAFVTDVGQLKDKSFNEGTWNGVKLYAAQNKLSYKYYQPANGANATDDDRFNSMARPPRRTPPWKARPSWAPPR